MQKPPTKQEIKRYIRLLQCELADKMYSLSKHNQNLIEAEITKWQNALHILNQLT